jgi:2-hydroxychromene-2-carboxylate isomerase
MDIELAGHLLPGSRFSGRVAGNDYLAVRPDGVAELDVRAAVTTDEEQIVSVRASGLATIGDDGLASRDLSDVDNVLIAAAACELHPNAVLRGIEMRSTKDRLREATREAYERGVRGVPTIAIGDELFWGDDRLEQAAAAVER